MSDIPCVTVAPLHLFEAVCHHPGCQWRQTHAGHVEALNDAATHEREWHKRRTLSNEEAILERQAKVTRVLTAARKVVDGPVSAFHPTHLGGCIGVLSEPSCDCGIGDLRFAMMALDKGE